MHIGVHLINRLDLNNRSITCSPLSDKENDEVDGDKIWRKGTVHIILLRCTAWTLGG